MQILKRLFCKRPPDPPAKPGFVFVPDWNSLVALSRAVRIAEKALTSVHQSKDNEIAWDLIVSVKTKLSIQLREMREQVMREAPMPRKETDPCAALKRLVEQGKAAYRTLEADRDHWKELCAYLESELDKAAKAIDDSWANG